MYGSDHPLLERLETCPGCLWTDTVPVVADQVGEFMILHVKGYSSSLVSRRLDLTCSALKFG